MRKTINNSNLWKAYFPPLLLKIVIYTFALGSCGKIVKSNVRSRLNQIFNKSAYNPKAHIFARNKIRNTQHNLWLHSPYRSISSQSDSQNADSPRLYTAQIGGDAIGSGDVVNLFRGNLGFPLELLSLPGRNGLECKMKLLYQSNVQYTIDKWNLDNPTDIVGMGWSLPYEQITLSPKGSASNVDNQYYLIMQGQTETLIPIPVSWSIGNISDPSFQKLLQGNVDTSVKKEFAKFNNKISNQIRLQKLKDGSFLLYDDIIKKSYKLCPQGYNSYQVSSTGQSFELENYQYWQITYYEEYQKWEIIKEDGTVYTYGNNDIQNTNPLQYGVQWGNWIGDTTKGNGQQYVDGWNLTKVQNIFGNFYTLEYQTKMQTVGQDSISYTKECHVSKITNDFNWSLQNSYLNKTYDTASPEGPKEYLDPHKDPSSNPSNTPDAYQSRYSTVYLDEIALINDSKQTVQYVKLDYYDLKNLTIENDNDPLSYGATYKRYLKSIKHYYDKDETKPGIEFYYDFTTLDSKKQRSSNKCFIAYRRKGRV